MKRTQVDTFEKLVGQLMGLYDELAILSKKNPNDALNKFKLKLINALLSQANQFLGEDYIPFGDFEVFDEDDMPRNSDVVLILSQYVQCFEKFRADNVEMYAGSWQWIVDPEAGEEVSRGGKAHIRTVRPKRLRE
ncbi:MAG: hypothetical protein CEE40_01190 [Chloroflexi bacterium B3_Chlor]|nr:MAG: hypothetical protein CEE40_01190 [Chloroflexi bacterium B3_Chlor]